MHFFQTMTLFDPPLLPTPSLGVGIDCNCIPFMNLSGGAGILYLSWGLGAWEDAVTFMAKNKAWKPFISTI